MNTFKLRTEVQPDGTIVSEVTDPYQQAVFSILRTQDCEVRKMLVKLGWTPPGVLPTEADLRAVCEAYEQSVYAAGDAPDPAHARERLIALLRPVLTAVRRGQGNHPPEV